MAQPTRTAPGEPPRDPAVTYGCTFSPWGLDYLVKEGRAEIGGKSKRIFYIQVMMTPSRCGSHAIYNDASMYYIIDETGMILRRLQAGEPDTSPVLTPSRRPVVDASAKAEVNEATDGGEASDGGF